jgi:hypothetical protein
VRRAVKRKTLYVVMREIGPSSGPCRALQSSRQSLFLDTATRTIRRIPAARVQTQPAHQMTTATKAMAETKLLASLS